MNRNHLSAAPSVAHPLASVNSSLSSSFTAGTGPGEVAGRDDAHASASPAGATIRRHMDAPTRARVFYEVERLGLDLGKHTAKRRHISGDTIDRWADIAIESELKGEQLSVATVDPDQIADLYDAFRFEFVRARKRAREIV